MEKCYADSYSTSLGQLSWSSISFWDQIVGLVLIDHFVMMNIMVAYILYYMPKSFHMMTSKVPHESSLIAVYMQQKWFLGGVMLFFPSLKLRYIAHLIFLYGWKTFCGFPFGFRVHGSVNSSTSLWPQPQMAIFFRGFLSDLKNGTKGEGWCKAHQ